MFEAFKNFVAELASGDRHPSGFGPDDYRLAAAALLVHAAVIDGKFSEAEQRTLRALLQERFALDDHQVDDLIQQATAAEQESVDLYQFTRLLNDKLDEAGRARVIEMMWQVAYADGYRSAAQTVARLAGVDTGQVVPMDNSTRVMAGARAKVVITVGADTAAKAQ